MSGLIAIPHRDTFPAKFVTSWTMQFNHWNEMGNPTTMWISHHYTHTAREMAARRCVEEKFDWLMFIDSDMTFPGDMIPRLLAHNLPIVGALAFKRFWPPEPTLYVAIDENMSKVATLASWNEGLLKVDATGCACLLIRREALEAIPQPWFPLNENGHGEDISFCHKAFKAKIPIHVDTTIKTGHVGMHEYTQEDFERAKRDGEFAVTMLEQGVG